MLTDCHISFKHAAETWLAEHARKVRVATNFDTTESRNRRLVDYFGKYKLTQFNEVMVERWKKTRRDSGASPNRDLTDLKAIFNWSWKAKKWIKENPIANVQKDKTRYKKGGSGEKEFNCGEDNREIVVTIDQQEIVYQFLDPFARLFCLFVYLGAFRPSEARLARWEDIERCGASQSLRIRKWNAKTQSPRSIPIFPGMDEILAAIEHSEGFIFSEDGGANHLGKSAIRLRFDAAREKAAKEPGFIDFQLRDLRRSRATHMAKGVGFHRPIPLHQIQILLGHASIRTTERYINIKESEQTVLDTLTALADTSVSILASPKVINIVTKLGQSDNSGVLQNVRKSK